MFYGLWLEEAEGTEPVLIAHNFGTTGQTKVVYQQNVPLQMSTSVK